MGIAFLMTLTYTETYIQRGAGRKTRRAPSETKRNEWIFFFQNLFHDFSNAKREGTAIFQRRHFTQISVAKILTLQLNQMMQ